MRLVNGNNNKRKLFEMSGLKRAFPFSDEDIPYTSSSDFLSVKRPCLPSKYNSLSQADKIPSIGTKTWEQTEMEHENYPRNYCKNGTLTYPEMQNGDMSCIEASNNNNNSTSICVRCQAGEPGHIGHIGR